MEVCRLTACWCGAVVLPRRRCARLPLAAKLGHSPAVRRRLPAVPAGECGAWCCTAQGCMRHLAGGRGRHLAGARVRGRGGASCLRSCQDPADMFIAAAAVLDRARIRCVLCAAPMWMPDRRWTSCAREYRTRQAAHAEGQHCTPGFGLRLAMRHSLQLHVLHVAALHAFCTWP